MSKAPNPALLTMLSYKRPHNSVTLEAFCQTFLEPVMGEPDDFGNYIHIIPDEQGLTPPVCFAAHSDTVHGTDGLQDLVTEGQLVRSVGKDCLGADCTTGCWLILEMIKAGIPGVYVIHAEEEIGCVGSSALVASRPEWLSDIRAVISFDRYGTKSIITHQMGYRTASDDFAHSLEEILCLGLEPDTGGSYTDSNEYADFVPECTNLSVGYYDQHTSKESQDVYFAYKLRDALIAADWSKLRISRDPNESEYLWARGGGWMSDWMKRSADSAVAEDESSRSWYTNRVEDLYDVEDLVRDFPELVAELFVDWGFDRVTLMQALEEFGGNDPDFINTASKAYA